MENGSRYESHSPCRLGLDFAAAMALILEKQVRSSQRGYAQDRQCRKVARDKLARRTAVRIARLYGLLQYACIPCIFLVDLVPA